MQGLKWAWERRSHARYFCKLAFPGLKERFFPSELEFSGRKDSFIHGNETSESGNGQDNGPTRNAGGRCKIETGPDFYRGPGIFFYRSVSTALKLHF